MFSRCAALVLLLLAGCQSGKHGHSGVEIMDSLPPPPPPASTKQTEVQNSEPVDYTPAHPYGELAKPEYPATALAAKAGSYEAYLKLNLDERGEIMSVEPSIRGLSLPHPYADAFHAAIREVMKQWQLRAACLTHYKEVEKDGEKTYVITRVAFIHDTLDVHCPFEASAKVR